MCLHFPCSVVMLADLGTKFTPINQLKCLWGIVVIDQIVWVHAMRRKMILSCASLFDTVSGHARAHTGNLLKLVGAFGPKPVKIFISLSASCQSGHENAAHTGPQTLWTWELFKRIEGCFHCTAAMLMCVVHLCPTWVMFALMHSWCNLLQFCVRCIILYYNIITP